MEKRGYCKGMRKRQTLETLIRQLLANHPADSTYTVKAFELWRDDMGWSTNDAWYLARNASLSEVLTITRGRWEVFKVNYAPRARVVDIADIGYEPGAYSLECNHLPFIDISLNK